MRIEQLDELGKIGERPRQAVDLIDNDDLNLARPDVGQKTLQGRAVGRATGVSAIVVARADQRPACVRLAADIGGGRIVLGVQ